MSTTDNNLFDNSAIKEQKYFKLADTTKKQNKYLEKFS